MKKLILFLLIGCFAVINLNAQNTGTRKKVAKKVITETKKKGVTDTESDGWTKGGEGLLNFSYTNFSKWVDGVANNTAIIGNLNLFADMKSGKWLWENDGRFVLGYVNTENISGWLKGDDVIDLDSKLGYKLSEKAFWSTLLTFDSQFAAGYNLASRIIADTTTADPIDVVEIKSSSDPISRFMSPGIITFGTGIDYKPLDWVSIYFSPVTFKGIIVNDDFISATGIHGNQPGVVDSTYSISDGEGKIIYNVLEAGQKFKPELGARLMLGAKKNLTDNISWMSGLELFSNFLDNKYGEKKPQNIDVNWVNTFGFKINKYLTATLENTLRYDDEMDVIKNRKEIREDGAKPYIGKDLQVKNFLGIGLTYKFDL